jgi:arsenite methyltransferase
VLGIEFGAEAVRLAQDAAPESSNVRFVRGGAERLPFRTGAFDAAVCECSVSLFINKDQAVSETARLLKRGGKFGLSDVTIVPGTLSPELGGELGQVLCMTNA